MPHVLITSHQGDPLAKKTWSGTTLNVAKTLEKLGARVSAVSAEDHWLSTAQRAVRYLRGKSTDKSRTQFAVHARYAQIERMARQLGDVDIILHCTTLTMPLTPERKRGVRAKQVILLDVTWDLAAQYQDVTASQGGSYKRNEETERRALHNADLILPIAEYVRDNIIQHYGVDPSKVMAVGTGLGEAIKPLQGEKDYSKGHVLFAAKNFWRRKGTQLILDTFDLLAKTHPEIRLKMLGMPEFEEFAKTRPNVEGFGFVSLEELQRMFDEAALFAMPAEYEPWGLVYLEALSTKTPILGLNRFAVPEFVAGGKHGFMVDQPDPQAIADAIVEALRDPERLRRMGNAGQEYALSQFSWERVARAILQDSP